MKVRNHLVINWSMDRGISTGIVTEINLFFFYNFILSNNNLKVGYLDFSHLPNSKNTYITEIYMKKEYKSSIIKNHEITNKNFFDGVSLKGYEAS